MAEVAPRHKPKTRGNGQGTAYKLPNGKWRAEVTLGYETIKDEETGKERKKRICKTKSGFKTKRDALAYIGQLRADAMEVNPRIQFRELYDKWSDTHFQTITKDTQNCYAAAYAHSKSLHYQVFADIKTQDLQAAIDECELGRRTKQNMKALWTCMYNYAIANDYISKNYAQFVKLPKKEESKKDAFTAEERDKLWKYYESGHDFAGYILIMIYTGMRYGEISKVLKADIHIKEQYLIGGIKTEAGKDRVIPLCKKILPVIKRLTTTDIENVCSAKSEKLLDMSEKKYYCRVADALKGAGVRILPPHCCRHTTATALAEAGVQPAIIKAILGHTDYSTTMQYTHVQKLPEMLEAINKI